MKRALITGITGQDGSYLAELLLDKGYEVFGLAGKRAGTNPTVPCSSWAGSMFCSGYMRVGIADCSDMRFEISGLTERDLSSRIPVKTGRILGEGCRNLNVNGMAAVRLFEAVRHHKAEAKVYHASSSEMFGQARDKRQNESTAFHPVNPYAAAKVYAHQMAQIYRNSYGLYIANGILFNHESERRPLHFLTRRWPMARLAPPLASGFPRRQRAWPSHCGERSTGLGQSRHFA